MSQTISSARLNESYTRIEHPSGLTLLLYPMEGFSTAYALFATKYGSIDTCFKTNQDDDFVQVPEGIAHFLEHKLFESEDGDAFSLYAKTGASANAFTSFDKTAYLFSCTENFDQSIEILLNFVTNPYFTEKTVQKEQGIIAQEIKMYEDNGNWRVFFNLLGALYHNNPVHIDIAGTVDSIAQINADLLYRCYNTFYNLHNMVLAVAGNFSPETVVAAADKILKKAPDLQIDRQTVTEPREVCKRRVEQKLPVSLPLFQIGFKFNPGTEIENLRGMILDEIALDIIAGDSTKLYRRLYDEGLINQTFSGESMAGRDYALAMFSGESRDPDKVYSAICEEIERIQREGIDEEVFNRYKKAAYGRYIGMYGRADAVAGLIVTTHFSEMDSVYDVLEILATITAEQMNARLCNTFNTEHSALSIVRG